jgi:two-component system, chemotaxis family, protein-glutamate methylesterase/glutaminase
VDPNNRLVVIGASAGGIEALRELVRGLPATFPAPLCVVLHLAPDSPGLVPQILGRAGPLRAVHPSDRQRLEAGTIYVAPPDHHLLVEPGRLRVTKGPRENRFRPAIDPLFRSAAQVYGPAAIGVVLTGNLDDGTAGLWTLKQMGGTAVVQDVKDAMFPSMPASAAHHVDVDYSVPLGQMPGLLGQLVRQAPGTTQRAVPKATHVEIDVSKGANPREIGFEAIAMPSRFACPECHGVLLQLKEGSRIRFRCHTGHAYSPASLLADIDQGIQSAMASSLRAVEEGIILLDQLATHLREAHGTSADSLEAASARAREQSRLLRQLIDDWQPLPAAEILQP